MHSSTSGLFVAELSLELNKRPATLANVLKKQLPSALVKRKNTNNRQANFVLEPGVQLLRSRYSNQVPPTTNNQEQAAEVERLSLLLESALADNDRLVQENLKLELESEYEQLLEDTATAEAHADELEAKLVLSQSEREKQLQQELAQAQVDLLVANRRNERLEAELAQVKREAEEELKHLADLAGYHASRDLVLTAAARWRACGMDMSKLSAADRQLLQDTTIEWQPTLEEKQAAVVEQVRAQVFGDDSNNPLVLAATGTPAIDVQAQPVHERKAPASSSMAESVRKTGEALESNYNKAAEGTKRVLKALAAQDKRNQEPTLASLQSSFDAVTERRATKKANALLERWSNYTTEELQQMADEGDATALSVVNERFADEYGYSSYAAYLHLEAQEQEVRTKANKRKPAPAKRVYKDYD